MNARLVDEYTAQATGYERSWLDLLFDRATIISGETSGGFFNNIWIPTRKYDPNTQKLAENYTYYNVGMSTAELSDLYWTEYSGNYLIGRQDDISIDFSYILTRVKAIFKKNLGKYRKLVELEGLEWNPLWNVDGSEIHQLLEKHASENNLFSESGASATGKNLKDEHKVSAYNSATKTEWEETHVGQGASNSPSVNVSSPYTTVADGLFVGQGASNSPSATVVYGDDTLTANGGSIADVDTSSSEARASRSHKTHDSFNYSIKVEDTAFGVAISDGGDVLHTEKTVRQGNIGVTKTTELIEDARRTVAFSIIQEFFDDINKVILVGLWGNYCGHKAKLYHHYEPSTAEIDHVEVDKFGHIVAVVMKGDSTEITPNQIIFANRISGQS